MTKAQRAVVSYALQKEKRYKQVYTFDIAFAGGAKLRLQAFKSPWGWGWKSHWLGPEYSYLSMS